MSTPKVVVFLLAIFCFAKVSFCQIINTKHIPDTTTVIYAENIVSQKPEFVGGNAAMIAWLMKNFRYPKAAKQATVSGELLARFTVNKDGSISDIDVLKEYGFGTREEVTRLIKAMPRWRAGKVDGKPVAMKYTLPIHIHPDQE